MRLWNRLTDCFSTQEHYLSRRTINFVNGQAYFRCRQRIWCEDLWSDRDLSFQDRDHWATNVVAINQEAMNSEVGNTAPHHFLFSAIERFQTRNLTNQNDAINAMTGILARVAQRAKTSILGGLPMDVLSLALLFIVQAILGAYQPPTKTRLL